MKTYYDILGISRNATQAQIKSAYRKLAKQYHPDMGEETEETRIRFQEIQEAYAVLSDPAKRKIYHYYGHAEYTRIYRTAPNGNHSANYSGAYSRDESGHSHEDGHCGACGHDEGGHSHGDGHCGACGHDEDGHSHEDGHCGACDHGRDSVAPPKMEAPPPASVRIAVWLELEDTLQEVVKDAIYVEKIPGENGRKPEERVWKFKVKIPAESFDHQFFFLGSVLYGSEAEAFFDHTETAYPYKTFVIIVLLKDRPGIIRQGYHLYMDHTVDYPSLVLGGPVVIPTPFGDVVCDLAPGTQTERQIRLVNYGLIRPKIIGGRGDMHVRLHVKIPQELTAKQKALLEQLRDAFEEEAEYC